MKVTMMIIMTVHNINNINHNHNRNISVTTASYHSSTWSGRLQEEGLQSSMVSIMKSIQKYHISTL